MIKKSNKRKFLLLTFLLAILSLSNGECNNYLSKKNGLNSSDLKNSIKVMPRYIKIDINVYVDYVLMDNLKARSIDSVRYIDDIFHFAGRVGVWHNILFKINKIFYLSPQHQFQINRSSIYKSILEFSKWHQNVADKADVSALLIDVPLRDYINNDGNYIGFGDLGIHCGNAVSINQVGEIVYYDPAYAGQLLAHEMGHNMGMPDLYTIPNGCNCLKTSLNCVMHSSHSRWNNRMNYFSYYSTCSIDLALASMRTGKNTCLYEFMESEHTSSSFCGNGIVDEGEDCDCGDEFSCQTNGGNQCCTPQCKFKDSRYQCFRGDCCEQCMFKRNIVCRSKTGPCDIPEFCDGQSDSCPNDHYMENGAKCDSNAYCFDGKCPTNENVCQEFFPGRNVHYSEICETLVNQEIESGCKAFFSHGDIFHQLCGANKIDGECGTRMHCAGDLGMPNSLYSIDMKNGQNYETCFIMGQYFSEKNTARPNGYGCQQDGYMCYNNRCNAASNFTGKCKKCPKYTVCSSKGTCRPNDMRYYQNDNFDKNEDGDSYNNNKIMTINDPQNEDIENDNRETEETKNEGKESNCFNLKLGNLGTKRVCLDINIY